MNKLWKMRNRKGFTIMELVAVIAVIGILAAVAIPTFVGSQTHVDEQEEKLYGELAKLEATPNGSELEAEISTDIVTVDSVTLNDATVQVGAVETISSSVIVLVNGSETDDPKYDPYRELYNWTSDNTSIAKVTNEGTVIGISAGEATITATSVVDKTETGTCTVKVTAAVTPEGGGGGDDPEGGDDEGSGTTGGKMSFECKKDLNIDGKCDITGETLEGKNHVCKQMSEVTSNYCFLDQCKVAYGIDPKYFTKTTNLNSDIPTVKMETDYTGDLTVDYYGVNEDGTEQQVAMILDLQGHTIKGCVHINGIADITSSTGKGKIINLENDTSDGIFITGSRAENSLYTGKVSNLHIEAKRYGIYVGNGADTKNNGGIWNSDIVAGKVGIYVAKKNTANANYRNIYQCNIQAPIGVEFCGNSSESINNCKIFATDIGVYLADGANNNSLPRVMNTFIKSENIGIKSDYKITIKIGEGNFVYAKNEALLVGNRAGLNSNAYNASDDKISIYYSERENGVHWQGAYSKSTLTSFYYNHQTGADTVEKAFVTDKYSEVSSTVTKWIEGDGTNPGANWEIKYKHTVNGVETKQPLQTPKIYTADFDGNNHTLTVTEAGAISLSNMKYLDVKTEETSRTKK